MQEICEQQSAFANIKQLILQSPTLAIYDDSKTLTVSVDARSNSRDAGWKANQVCIKIFVTMSA